jgi:hypothetical protein
MDQLLEYASDSHALHTKLLHLDVPFAMMPCVVTEFEAQTRRNPTFVAMVGFKAEPPNRREYTAYTSPVS